jgi:hypothetical protein
MLRYRQEIDVQGRHFPRGDIAIQIARTGTTGTSSARRYTPDGYAFGRTSWRGSEGSPTAARHRFFRTYQTYGLQQDPQQDVQFVRSRDTDELLAARIGRQFVPCAIIRRWSVRSHGTAASASPAERLFRRRKPPILQLAKKAKFITVGPIRRANHCFKVVKMGHHAHVCVSMRQVVRSWPTRLRRGGHGTNASPNPV